MRDQWTDRQKRIFEGLSAIGQEIAGFYEAGLKIYFGDCPNGAYFLLHAAREIDGGLRDVLAVDYVSDKKENEKHKKSILFSLGAGEFEGLAEDWFKISKELHHYAHRHGAWKSPRQLSDVKPIWDQYESILERLVGSYYAIIERIERIGKITNLQGGVVETLCNILAIPTYYNYFFRGEKSTKWFTPLKEKDWFSPHQIKFDEQGNAFFWNVLDYLERVSEQVEQNSSYNKDLIGIIDSIVQFSLNKKRINNPHIWWFCVKILNNIPLSIIKDNLNISQFHGWLTVWADRSSASDLAISDVGTILLPKFLADNSTVDYAETIIDVITEIRTGEQSASTVIKEDAVFAGDSYWIRDAFQKNYKLIGQKCSVKAVLRLAEKLRISLEYNQQFHYQSVRIGQSSYRILVSRIFVEGIRAGEISFKDDHYECVLKEYAPGQLKEINSENDFESSYRLYYIEPQIELKRFEFAATDRNTMAAAIKQGLPAEINWKAAANFEEKLENVFDGLCSDYSHIWCRSLSQGPEYDDDAKEVLTNILRDVLLAKCEASRSDGNQILAAFLSDEYRFPIFRRFALLFIDTYWTDYCNFLDNFFDLYPTALAESDFEVELQDILGHHNTFFSPLLKKRLLELIINVPEYYIEKGEQSIAYWKYKWLSPMKENPDFSVMYEEARQKAEEKEPYEAKRSAFSSEVFGHGSPISKEDILQKSIDELVQYLREFQGDESPRSVLEDKPDRQGLGEILRVAVQEDPKKFTEEMGAFLLVDYYYVHRILSGLEKAWNDGKDIDWKKIFEFSIKYFSKDSLIEDAQKVQGEDSGNGKYVWVIEDIVDLIADGCRNDQRAFSPEYFDKAEQIFEQLLPLLKGEAHPDIQRDVLTYAMNTTLGRTIIAYISFSLRKARATQKREENWGQKRYERFFAIGVEAYIWFGSYLAQMKYLDEEYTKNKIQHFTQKDSGDFEWQMFMEGYLTGATKVYPEVYSLMRTNYVKALASKTLGEQTNRRLVEHIALGYLYYGESLDENNADGGPSLFWKMLAEANNIGKKDRWLKVASFFWSFTGRTISKEGKDSKKEIEEEIRKKIMEFWAWTFDKQDFVKANLGNDYNSLLGQMAELTILLDKIDEVAERWLLLCAPYIDLHHGATFFIEYLTKFDDEESIRRIGKIFLKVLENTTPTFRQENIESIVRRIYDKGDRSDADAICNTYGRRGIHFLKPLWEEYQKKSNSYV